MTVNLNIVEKCVSCLNIKESYDLANLRPCQGQPGIYRCKYHLFGGNGNDICSFIKVVVFDTGFDFFLRLRNAVAV